MREVISVHVGQAGVQLGKVCWELYCLEHRLDLSGRMIEDEEGTMKVMKTNSNLHESYERDEGLKPSNSTISDVSRQSSLMSAGFQSFFEEMSEGNFIPRAIMVDLEPTVIDELKTGALKSLFSPNKLLNGVEDAANNYARGHYTAGGRMIGAVMEPVRKMSEVCEKLQGFMIFHSFGGGTGSGFAALLTDAFGREFPKRSKLDIAIFPSPTMSTAVVEPYNAVLATSFTLDKTDCVFLADNEALYNICKSKLDIDSPTYLNLNQLLSQTVSSVTASLRFQGTLNADFSDFQTNLVPFPRIHFPVVSYAPIVSKKNCSHQTLSVAEITNKCFECTNRMVKCDNEKGRYMSCCLLYRGDVGSKDVNAAIKSIKTKKGVKFVNWSPTGFKVGINGSAPCCQDTAEMASLQRAACMMCNTTAIKDAWERLNAKYHVMFKKKAFTHWYTEEGMDISEFHEAQDNILTLEDEYELLTTGD